jgi:hypothetical protein
VIALECAEFYCCQEAAIPEVSVEALALTVEQPNQERQRLLELAA